MKLREYHYYACDFETTVWGHDEVMKYGEQTKTEVWSACFAELYQTEEPIILGNIRDFMKYFLTLKQHSILYFHNLKFDGSFILDWLLRNGFEWCREPEKDMGNGTFKCSISTMGAFYNIIIKYKNFIVEFRDSVKLMPFSLDAIGKAFETEHRKLEMEYVGNRYPDCPISKQEEAYIKNDVYVLKEALEIMFNEGHDKLTIGSCCLAEFKSTYSKEDYELLFPNLYEISIDQEVFDFENAGEYIRASYRGGFCWVKKGEEGKVQEGGSTYDINSHYPSQMSSESGNEYPTGKPCFWAGDIPEKAQSHLYFVRFTCSFKLKEGYIPTVQIKHNLLYKGNEYLETSDICENGKYYHWYKDPRDGEVKEALVTMTMTSADYKMFLEHYTVENLTIHSGCWFYSEKGLFDEYINKYKFQKMTTKGAKRTQAKLFMNNLYGKMAASDDSSYKIPYLDKEKDCVRFEFQAEHEQNPGYIAAGSFITSYARCFTIQAAQDNYDNFIYADTDSMHILGTDVRGIKIHPSDFCCWKNETKWHRAVFTRQKTYVEELYEEDGEPATGTLIRCAGMGKGPRKWFLENCSIEDFKVGLRCPGQLRVKRMHGGILLKEGFFEIK